MMNTKEKSEIKYVMTRLNEIVSLTHGIRLEFNEEDETVSIFNLTAGKTAAPLNVVNIADDSTRGALEDVMREINAL